MEFEQYLITAFIIGLLGAIHCIGMCGGIVGTLALGIANQPNKPSRQLSFMLAYNFGRITSYTFAGAIAGLAGSTVLGAVDHQAAMLATKYLTAAFMIGLGLYLAGWTQFLAPIEAVGHKFWKRIQPYSQKFIPIKTTPQAFIVGMIWGWLPCGLVYSALVWALASSDPITGALTMLAFGLATLPALMASGLSAAKFSQFSQNIWLRRGVGFALISFALINIFIF